MRESDLNKGAPMSDLIKLNQDVQMAPTQLPAEAVEAAEEYASQAKSANTVRAYRAQVNIWLKWAATHCMTVTR